MQQDVDVAQEQEVAKDVNREDGGARVLDIESHLNGVEDDGVESGRHDHSDPVPLALGVRSDDLDLPDSNFLPKLLEIRPAL